MSLRTSHSPFVRPALRLFIRSSQSFNDLNHFVLVHVPQLCCPSMEGEVSVVVG